MEERSPAFSLFSVSASLFSADSLHAVLKGAVNPPEKIQMYDPYLLLALFFFCQLEQSSLSQDQHFRFICALSEADSFPYPDNFPIHKHKLCLYSCDTA